MSVAGGLARNSASQAATAFPADDTLHSVFGRFATGVTVVATGGEMPCGMTANSFTSVSTRPPLILVCVNRSASIHRAVLERESFAVSILSARQEHVARYFADRSRPRGVGEFGSVDWWPAPRTGAPIVDGALAWIDCDLAASYDGGDHAIFLGSVLAGGWEPEHDALLFFGSQFHRPRLVMPGLRETA